MPWCCRMSTATRKILRSEARVVASRMVGSFVLALACSAMAVTARRTLAKVKSSGDEAAPSGGAKNLMGEVVHNPSAGAHGAVF